MKLIRQFGIITAFSFGGELLRYVLPLPIPASIYGMVLLFAALETGLLKVSHLREASHFLIEIMPLMFIPAGVGLLDTWGVLRPVFVQILLTVFVSTVLVMAVSGRVTQRVIRIRRKAVRGDSETETEEGEDEDA